jgi:CRP-like cAMP-binding protein
VPTAGPSDLASVPLFGALSERELAEAASWFEVKTVGPGVRLVGEGATGFSFFIVSEGAVEVTAGGVAVASLGPGDFFGEMALLGGVRRTATVTTVSSTRVLVLFGEDFRRLQANHPDIVARIEAAMHKRLEERTEAEPAPSTGV